MSTSENSGTRLTDFDLTLEQRAQATRIVASIATDASDCRTLLDILGLSPREARQTSDRTPSDLPQR